jgi:C-terminal processing protease CtpA/Prc
MKKFRVVLKLSVVVLSGLGCVAVSSSLSYAQPRHLSFDVDSGFAELQNSGKQHFSTDSRDFVGIGVRIDFKEYHGSARAKPAGAVRPYIFEPLEGSPAAKAGLKERDVVLEVDGKSTAGMKEERFVSLIRGKRGTRVRLKIERKHRAVKGGPPPEYETFEVNVTRDIIRLGAPAK